MRVNVMLVNACIDKARW